MIICNLRTFRHILIENILTPLALQFYITFEGKRGWSELLQRHIKLGQPRVTPVRSLQVARKQASY